MSRNVQVVGGQHRPQVGGELYIPYWLAFATACRHSFSGVASFSGGTLTLLSHWHVLTKTIYTPLLVGVCYRVSLKLQ